MCHPVLFTWLSIIEMAHFFLFLLFDRTELAKLPGDSKIFTAIDSDPALSKFMDNHTPVEARIGLKVK